MQKGFKEITLEELKENTLNNNTLNLDLKEVLGIALYDNKEYIYKVIERKKTAENNKKQTNCTNPLGYDPSKFALLTLDREAKDPIVNHSYLGNNKVSQHTCRVHPSVEDVTEETINKKRQEKSKTVLDKKEPYKETEGKLYYELSWEFIEEMAKRMQYHKNGKYELYNWKNKPMTPKGIDDMKQAINRHHIEVMKGNYDDGEEFLGHIVSYATNSMILWGQLKLNKS